MTVHDNDAALVAMECPVDLVSPPLFNGFYGGVHSPLLEATIETYSVEVFQRLLDIGADPMEEYKAGMRNAMTKCAWGDKIGDKIRALVASPLQDLHWKDGYGQTYAH